MNIALSGINLNYQGVKTHEGKLCYNLTLDYNEIDYIDTKIMLNLDLRLGLFLMFIFQFTEEAILILINQQNLIILRLLLVKMLVVKSILYKWS